MLDTTTDKIIYSRDVKFVNVENDIQTTEININEQHNPTQDDNSANIDVNTKIINNNQENNTEHIRQESNAQQIELRRSERENKGIPP